MGETRELAPWLSGVSELGSEADTEEQGEQWWGQRQGHVATWS